jgi:hypothetical protein
MVTNNAVAAVSKTNIIHDKASGIEEVGELLGVGLGVDKVELILASQTREVPP